MTGQRAAAEKGVDGGADGDLAASSERTAGRGAVGREAVAGTGRGDRAAIPPGPTPQLFLGCGALGVAAGGCASPGLEPSELRWGSAADAHPPWRGGALRKLRASGSGTGEWAPHPHPTAPWVLPHFPGNRFHRPVCLALHTPRMLLPGTPQPAVAAQCRPPARLVQRPGSGRRQPSV